MKKTMLTIALVSAVAIASAQDMLSKKGTPILPEANDWSIGIAVNPFFEYFGNLMNGTTNNSAPSWDFTNSDQIITAKMMKDENTAYRAKIRLGFGSGSDETGDTASGTLSKTKDSDMNIALGVGLQKYRGKGRLKGIYGAEAMIGLSSEKTSFEYNGTTPTGAITESKQGSTFDLGIRGFIGAEYFFAPKMSVGGEFGWGIGFSSTGASENSFEGGSTVVTSGKSSDFGVDTDNDMGFSGMSGTINLNFYF